MRCVGFSNVCVSTRSSKVTCLWGIEISLPWQHIHINTIPESLEWNLPVHQTMLSCIQAWKFGCVLCGMMDMGLKNTAFDKKVQESIWYRYSGTIQEPIYCPMPHSTAYHIDKNWPFAKTINTPSLLLLCSISHASLTPTDRYSTSVQVAREPIISSSLLVIVWNKHEWTSEGIVSTM